jgi:hypothetical protein
MTIQALVKVQAVVLGDDFGFAMMASRTGDQRLHRADDTPNFIARHPIGLE